jgi:outer membrane protein assembly factor BamB
MSTDKPPALLRSILQIWLPLILIVALAAVWLWPAEDFDRFHRVAYFTFPIVGLALLLLLAWWFFLSEASWSVRLTLPLLVALSAVAAIRKVDFTGDMVPIFLFRWESNPAAELAAYRQSQSEVPVAQTDAPEPPLPEDDPSDYPEYRNRARDGVARGPALARDWSAKPPRKLWEHQCGGGYAGFAVAGNDAVTIEQWDKDNEAVVCYDAATGTMRWHYQYPGHFWDARAEGPMATPTLVGGDVYSLGGTGQLVCLRRATGKLKWQVDVLADNKNLTWGMSGSPLVYDDVVVVSPGEQTGSSQGRSAIAYNRKTGARVWGVGNARGGYSSPMLAYTGRVRQVIVLEGARLVGYSPVGAGELWSIPWESQNGINVAQPLLLQNDRIFVSSGYPGRCEMVRLAKQDSQLKPDPAIGIGCGSCLALYQAEQSVKLKPEKEWQNAALRCRFCSPVLHEGLIYGLDEGTLSCLNPQDGRRVWRGGRYRQGQLLRCDDLLLIMSELGELALVHAAGDKSRELGRLKVLPGDKNWNCPCLAGGKAYIRNHEVMACYDLRE